MDECLEASNPKQAASATQGRGMDKCQEVSDMKHAAAQGRRGMDECLISDMKHAPAAATQGRRGMDECLEASNMKPAAAVAAAQGRGMDECLDVSFILPDPDEELKRLVHTIVELGGQEGDDIPDQARTLVADMEHIMEKYSYLKSNNQFVTALSVLCKSNVRSVRQDAERLLLTIDTQFIQSDCANPIINLIRSGIVTEGNGK